MHETTHTVLKVNLARQMYTKTASSQGLLETGRTWMNPQSVPCWFRNLKPPLDLWSELKQTVIVSFNIWFLRMICALPHFFLLTYMPALVLSLTVSIYSIKYSITTFAHQHSSSISSFKFALKTHFLPSQHWMDGCMAYLCVSVCPCMCVCVCVHGCACMHGFLIWCSANGDFPPLTLKGGTSVYFCVFCGLLFHKAVWFSVMMGQSTL